MTLLQAISTGRLYGRTGGIFMKSERPLWPIRWINTGGPVTLSEGDIKADDWVLDIRMTNHGNSWMYCFSDWEKYKKEEVK